jgi:type VI secretion system protein ImpK
MHACLSLGFGGQDRGSASGANELARVRRDVYQTLRHLKGRADDDVSPHWRGLTLKMRELGSRVPLWAIGSAAVALLVAVFFALRILLGGDVDDLSDKLIALNPTIPITLERTSNFVPAVVKDTRDQGQLERIREHLGTVDDKCVAADSVGDSIVIKVCNVLLFDSGSATVKPAFADLAKRIADALQAEPGTISIVGYTDNVKPSGVGRYKSNYDLSVARAKSVEEIISPSIGDPTRLHVEGKGELDPIADNGTADGRAQNRRVEITIPRQETLPQQT